VALLLGAGQGDNAVAFLGMVKKFTSYLVVGGIAFIIDTGITLVLAQHFHYVAANTAGFVVANGVNFLLAHKWVFHGKLEALELGRAYWPTLAVSIVGLLLSNLFMVLFVGLAGWHLLSAKILTTILVLAWNFFGRIKFIYK
jgi:putative flippase GtrA